MRTISIRDLKKVRDEAELLSLVRDYLGDWLPEELAELPGACRPGKIRDAEDIGDLAFELTRQRMQGNGPQHLLVEMETFFAHAAARLSALDAAPGRKPREESSSDSA